MHLLKCDICKKVIKDREGSFGAGMGFNHFDFCEKCGRPIHNFLAQNKLLEENKKVGLSK